MSKTNYNKRLFLLGFFHQEVDKNEAKELNGFVLFKHWDGHNNRWMVSIFTKDSFRKMGRQEETLF